MPMASCAVHIDPIEKKPFFHFLPSTRAFSIATAGCNLACRNCQNWQISQVSPTETDNYDLMPPGLWSNASTLTVSPLPIPTPSPRLLRICSGYGETRA